MIGPNEPNWYESVSMIIKLNNRLMNQTGMMGPMMMSTNDDGSNDDGKRI